MRNSPPNGQEATTGTISQVIPRNLTTLVQRPGQDSESLLKTVSTTSVTAARSLPSRIRPFRYAKMLRLCRLGRLCRSQPRRTKRSARAAPSRCPQGRSRTPAWAPESALRPIMRPSGIHRGTHWTMHEAMHRPTPNPPRPSAVKFSGRGRNRQGEKHPHSRQGLRRSSDRQTDGGSGTHTVSRPTAEAAAAQSVLPSGRTDSSVSAQATTCPPSVTCASAYAEPDGNFS